MPTVMDPRNHSVDIMRTTAQKVCIGMGYVLILVGLAGSVMPALMKMHLSMSHNLFHIVSGALALWAGYSDNPNRAFNFSLLIGAVYGALGITGFLMGSPGYPSVGHMESDQNLWRTIPNVLELGSMDHFVHIFLSIIFLFTSWSTRRTRSPRGTILPRTRQEHPDLNEINRRTTLHASMPKKSDDVRHI